MHRSTLVIALPALQAMLSLLGDVAIPTVRPSDVPTPSLWESPADLSNRDLFNGPWGSEHAPEPNASYRLVERKHSGVNPGMTVRGPDGREWSVKQAPLEYWADEGPVEVALSRVLSAVGYHQPPVYYLPSFTLQDDWGSHTERGGRFRLKHGSLKDRGAWSWRQNPFAGTRPLKGLLVILLMFNSSDLKESNNTLYEYRSDTRRESWYVVRDLGTALGSTGWLVPRKNDADEFERLGFIKGIHQGFVAFEYRGRHQDIVRDRIAPEDVRWAANLLAGLSDRQWHDAFRAGGYTPDVATRFVRKLQTKIVEGQRLPGDTAGSR